MQKKGQITIYMIFGVLILFFVAIILLSFGYVKQGPFQQDMPTAFKQYVEGCLQQTAIDGLYRMGQYAADMDLHPQFLQNSYFNTNFAVINEKSDLIALEPDAQKKLERYIAENMEKCVDYELFKEQGAEFFISGSPEASVVFGRNDVNVAWKREITMNPDKTTSIKFDPFQTKIFIPMKLVYAETVDAISLMNEDGYDLTQLREFDGNVFGARFKEGAVVVQNPHEIGERRETQPYLFVYGID